MNKKELFDILCCPFCKSDIIEGNSKINCSKCGRIFSYDKSIPRMYISDEEIIANSGNHKQEKFIINKESLKRMTNSVETKKENRIFLLLGRFSKFFILSGYISISSSILLSLLNRHSSINFILLIFSFLCFGSDYIIYRKSSNIKYRDGLFTLMKLDDEDGLSEYDIRANNQDNLEMDKRNVERQLDFVGYKSGQIQSILDRYGCRGRRALNIGCGGAIHKQLSQPYFDRGNDMVGVDISEEYLIEYEYNFNTKTVQANSMALPFKDNSFYLINFTDILEHLHHPLIGLSEAYRVLKQGGILILTTNNHHFSPRCMNPFVFFERMISVYYDKVLPPRNLLANWMNFSFYHTEFSRKEVADLANSAGFEILSLETCFPLPDLDLLTKIIKKLPCLKHMGSEFLIVLRK